MVGSRFRLRVVSLLCRANILSGNRVRRCTGGCAVRGGTGRGRGRPGLVLVMGLGVGGGVGGGVGLVRVRVDLGRLKSRVRVVRVGCSLFRLIAFISVS